MTTSVTMTSPMMNSRVYGMITPNSSMLPSSHDGAVTLTFCWPK